MQEPDRPHRPPRLRRPKLGPPALAIALLCAACSPLKTFDAFIPKDRGGIRVASAVAYGDGPRRMLDVYAPRAAARIGAHLAPRTQALRPVIIFFYGGSWNSGTRSGYSFVGRALAARGFVAIIPDYRLVPEVRYPGFVEDGAAAVAWAEAHARDYGGDPGRIVLMGHSAGAYIAAMLAVDERWLGSRHAAVKGLVGLAGPYDFAPFDVPASQAAFGDWPRPSETQPVTYAGAGDPPALLIVGGEDQVVRAANSEALAHRLRAGGVHVRLVRYAKVGHVGLLTAFARPLRGRAQALAETAAFVDQVAGGR
jgi:acetyl esterase/lipase